MTDQRRASPASGDMTSAPLVLRLRLRELREARGLTATELAERCQALGLHRITRGVITNLESGPPRKQSADVDELVALAYALGVSPVHLLVLPDPDVYRVGDHELPVEGVFGVEIHGPYEWISGTAPADDADRDFWTDHHPDALVANTKQFIRMGRLVEESRRAMALMEALPEFGGVARLMRRLDAPTDEEEEADDGGR